MPFDIQNFTLTPNGTISVTVEQYTVSAKVVEPRRGGAVLFDFTGANTVSWPQVLHTLTDAQRQELIRNTLVWLLQIKTGLS